MSLREYRNMDKQGKSLSLTFLGNQAKKSESYYLEYRSCSQTIWLASGLDIPEQNSNDPRAAWVFPR